MTVSYRNALTPRCHRLRWIVALLLLAVAVRPARADEFKTHYDLALALYQAQKYEESIPEFKAAYAITPKNGLLFNIAQAYRKSGHLREAIEYYDRYLSAEPQLDGDTRRKVDSYLSEARNTLAALELEMKQRLAEEKARREREPEPDPVAAPLQPPPPLVLADQPPARPVPVYKRWWFWTAIGGAVAAGVIVGVAVGVSRANAPFTVASTTPRASLSF